MMPKGDGDRVENTGTTQECFFFFWKMRRGGSLSQFDSFSVRKESRE